MNQQPSADWAASAWGVTSRGLGTGAALTALCFYAGWAYLDGYAHVFDVSYRQLGVSVSDTILTAFNLYALLALLSFTAIIATALARVLAHQYRSQVAHPRTQAVHAGAGVLLLLVGAFQYRFFVIPKQALGISLLLAGATLLAAHPVLTRQYRAALGDGLIHLTQLLLVAFPLVGMLGAYASQQGTQAGRDVLNRYPGSVGNTTIHAKFSRPGVSPSAPQDECAYTYSDYIVVTEGSAVWVLYRQVDGRNETVLVPPDMICAIYRTSH